MDADGVLVNGEQFSKVLARDFDVDPAKEQEFFTTIFQDCLIGKADLKEAITPYLASFGWKSTADEFLGYWFKAEHGLNDELISHLQKLRHQGIFLALATNQEKYRTQYMLDHMGFAEVFDKIYSSAHLGLKKPAIEFFAKVVDDLGAKKSEVLFWDDDQQNIDGAKSYGIHAEFYTDYDAFRPIMKKYGFKLE